MRLVWPDWRSADPAGRHPHWRAEEVAGPDGPRPRVLAALLDAVVDAATLRIDDDAFVARLARADSAQELAHRRAELARRQQAALDDRAAAHELVDEYQRELTIADDEVFRLEAALEREHELRLRAEHAYLHLATRTETDAGPDPELRSLGDVVRLAKARLDHLVILPEAERSARDVGLRPRRSRVGRPRAARLGRRRLGRRSPARRLRGRGPCPRPGLGP